MYFNKEEKEEFKIWYFSVSNEKVIMDIYEALVHLQYPKITLINPKDVETQILGGDNRIYLLSWLLQQNTKISLPLLNKLKGEALEG